MNWRDQYKHRDKKRAAEIPPEEFAGVLDPSEDFPSGHFLIGDEERGYRISLWHRERGLYSMRSHDNALCFAMTEYLLANGALRFSSSAEVKEFALMRGWSVQRNGEPA
jgi:hypothetical protein